MNLPEHSSRISQDSVEKRAGQENTTQTQNSRREHSSDCTGDANRQAQEVRTPDMRTPGLEQPKYLR